MISPASQLLDRAVRAYVAAGSGISRRNVIEGSRSTPSPRVVYATVKLIADLPQGFVWTTNERNGIVLDTMVFESSTLDYSVQFFRAGAYDAARQFKLWAKSPMGIQEAERRGLTLIDVSGVTQDDAVVSEDWEQRAGLNLTLGIVSTLVEQPGVGGSLEIDLCYDGVDPIDISLTEADAA